MPVVDAVPLSQAKKLHYPNLNVPSVYGNHPTEGLSNMHYHLNSEDHRFELNEFLKSYSLNDDDYPTILYKLILCMEKSLSQAELELGDTFTFHRTDK